MAFPEPVAAADDEPATPEEAEASLRPDRRRPRASGTLVRLGIVAAGAVPMLTGGFWLASWLNGQAAAWSAVGVITMKTNMAVGQLAAGAALLLLHPHAGGRVGRAIGAGLAALVLSLGGLTLAEHVSGRDFGIDQLLARELPFAAATTSPNRMGPPGALSLVLAGVGLLALLTRGRRLAVHAGLAMCAVNVIPAIGYLYGARPLYSVAGLTGIAPASVVALLSLGAGLVLAAGHESWSSRLRRDDPGGALLRRTLPIALVIPLLLGFLVTFGARRGIVDSVSGAAALVSGSMLLLAVLLWQSARGLSLAAARRSRAAAALRASERRARRHAEQLEASIDRSRRLEAERESALALAREQRDRSAAVARLYEVLSRANEAIVRTRDEQELYEQTCRIVAEVGGFPLVWIGRVRGREISPVAASGPALDYLGEVRIETDGHLGSGPTGTSVREDRSVVNADFETDAAAAPWRDAARSHGFRASASFPLHRQDEVVGALAVYASAPGAFDAEHVRLLEALAADVSYALDAIDRERRRAETELALRQSERALREADRQKTEFMAVLSHELRNPLAPIRNSLYILDHAPPGGDQAKRALAVIDRQVSQLARLVDDLLDVTRISRNKVKLQRERLELNELTRRTIEDHRSLFESAGVEVRFQRSPSPVFVDADWNRLAQVIGNLLHNARKFTARGGSATVEVAEDRGRRLALLRVADTGVGIEPETLASLFEPFVQADRTLDRSGGGLGLGLALVKGLVALHGGEVAARSAGPDSGAEFEVSLPLADAAAPAGARPGAEAPPPRRRLLVVEDNADGAQSLKEALEIVGHEVEVAADGPRAITRARELRPDVVLCDIGLPGMSGFEVARRLRQDPDLAGLSLVALTGYALPDDIDRVHEAGFDAHLAKPPSIARLEDVLAALPRRATRGSGRP